MQPFDHDPIFLIHDVARMMRTRFDQRARMHGMTRAQWIILWRLARQPGVSQNEMATVCEVEPISVCRLIDRLEARGLVERRSDPGDRRIKRLHLTPAAQPLLDEISRYLKQQSNEVLNGLSEPVRAELVNALLQVKNNLTAETAAGPPQVAVRG